MASTGPNNTQPLSSFICPSFTLSLIYPPRFCTISHSIVSLCSYTLCPYILPASCTLLCSFYHPIHCFSICTLTASFYLSLSLSHSRSLFCCLTLSLYPIPSRCRTTSVELIRYSRHIWTALTGINHECFWSAHTGFFRLLVVCECALKAAYEVPYFCLHFHAKSLTIL